MPPLDVVVMTRQANGTDVYPTRIRTNWKWCFRVYGNLCLWLSFASAFLSFSLHFFTFYKSMATQLTHQKKKETDAHQFELCRTVTFIYAVYHS